MAAVRLRSPPAAVQQVELSSSDDAGLAFAPAQRRTGTARSDSDDELPPPKRRTAGGSAAEKAAAAAARREAAAGRKTAKETEKAAKAVARQEHRAATGKLAAAEVTAVLDTRLAATAMGRALGALLEREKLLHAVASLPIPHSVCWVRHAAREAPWDGPFPWPGAPAAAAAAAAGVQPVPYVLLVLDAAAATAAVESRGSLEHLAPQVRVAHPGATLCVCTIGLHAYLRSRERSEFSLERPVGGFSRQPVDLALARLVTHVRGVRQRAARDADTAAEHALGLTQALAKQPYRAEESFLVLFGGEKKGSRLAAAWAPGPDAEAGATGGRKHARQLSLPDAWVAALTRVPGCSADTAAAIARAYPSMARLMAAYRAPGLTEAAAKGLVANLQRDAAQPGSKARRVGPAASLRLWQLFRPRAAGDPGAEEL